MDGGATERAAAKGVVAEFFATTVAPLDAAAAERLIAPGYRDHTFEADGVAAVEAFLESAAAAAAQLPEPVFTIADGDLVTTLHHLPQPMPDDPASYYDYFWPNTFRVRDGKLVEAWPGINRIAPLRTPDPAREVDAVEARDVDAAGVAANKRLVHDFFLRVFEAHDPAAVGGFVTEDYRQHSDLVPPGRAGLESFVTTIFPDGPVTPPPAALANPPRLTVAEGDIVVVVPLLPQPSPDDPGGRYPFFLHDSLRVRDGRLTDHWSGVDRLAPPRPGDPDSGPGS